MRQHDRTPVQHDTTQHNTSTSSAAKIVLSALLLNYIYIYFSEIVNIVIHVTLIKPFEFQGLIILLSETLKQPRSYDVAKLSGILDIKLKIAIQVPKTNIYTLFCVFSTITMASEN